MLHSFTPGGSIPLTSRRTAPLPSNWAGVLRPAVLHRDEYRCRIQGPHCTVLATEVDHRGAPWDHRPHMLQAACATCHATKTGKEARAKQPNRRRPTGPHPGVIE
jgi:5-methylcytosine-specific restriction enzyme A